MRRMRVAALAATIIATSAVQAAKTTRKVTPGSSTCIMVAQIKRALLLGGLCFSSAQDACGWSRYGTEKNTSDCGPYGVTRRMKPTLSYTSVDGIKTTGICRPLLPDDDCEEGLFSANYHGVVYNATTNGTVTILVPGKKYRKHPWSPLLMYFPVGNSDDAAKLSLVDRVVTDIALQRGLTVVIPSFNPYDSAAALETCQEVVSLMADTYEDTCINPADIIVAAWGPENLEIARQLTSNIIGDGTVAINGTNQSSYIYSGLALIAPSPDFDNFEEMKESQIESNPDLSGRGVVVVPVANNHTIWQDGNVSDMDDDALQEAYLNLPENLRTVFAALGRKNS